jgi:hypothetical protein
MRLSGSGKIVSVEEFFDAVVRPPVDDNRSEYPAELTILAGERIGGFSKTGFEIKSEMKSATD